MRTALVIGLAAVSTAAIALPAMLPIFGAAYKQVPKGSALAKANCATCHTAAPKLNPYGTDIKKALGKSKTLTPEVLKAVECLDSDKDGVKNIDEINKGSLPGDPKSK
jgi:mono/diheme cytochrome c family protein